MVVEETCFAGVFVPGGKLELSAEFRRFYASIRSRTAPAHCPTEA
jgi:hypothetical protein